VAGTLTGGKTPERGIDNQIPEWGQITNWQGEKKGSSGGGGAAEKKMGGYWGNIRTDLEERKLNDFGQWWGKKDAYGERTKQKEGNVKRF